MNWRVDYDSIAPTFDRRYERNEYAGVEQVLLQFARKEPGLRILEVGCGTGHWLEVLHAEGLHVTGLDPSAGMLAQARARLPGRDLVRGQAEHLPWGDQSFDRLFCINAIHHFVDKAAFLTEAKRILRPGGILLTIGLDPHTGTDQFHIYDYFPQSAEIDRQRYPSSSMLHDWMRSAGFEDPTTREVEHWIMRLPAREALEQGRLDKTSTSQLSVLTDEAYEQGLQRIKEDIRRAEAKGLTLFLMTDLRLFGTSASRST